jgi:hypothetical protein
MFGFKSFFAALTRLSAAVTRSAELFETANEQLAQRLGFDDAEELAQFEHNTEEATNARRSKRVSAKS